MRMVIQAQAQTAGAFADVNRQISSVQNQIAFFNRFALNLPRAFNSVFVGLGSAIDHAGRQIGGTVTMLGVLFTAWGSGTSKILDNLGRLFGVLGGAVSGVGKAIGGLFGIVGALGSLFFTVLGQIIGVVTQLASAIASQLVGALHQLATVATIAGVALGAALGVIGKAGLDFNSFREQTIISFEVMFRSADEAKRKFEFLKRFADITPFDTKETIEAGKLLASYGLDIERFITVAGNMAAAFNKPLTQAVDLLARAKAGIFSAREFAPLGITRDRLKSVGAEFTSTGKPADREHLLDAVTRVVERDFGGMMERQSRTNLGLFSTLKAFFTEDLPGAVTRGMASATNSIQLFLVNLMNMVRANGQFDRLTQAFGKIFDVIAAVAQQAALYIPIAINWFDQLVQTGKWDEFLQRVWHIVLTLFNLIVQGGAWLVQNWDKIWSTIGTIIVGFIRVGGGIIAGFINMLVEMVNGNINVQKSFHNIGEGIRGFAVESVHSITKIVEILFILQVVLGLVQFAVGALFKSIPHMVQGVLNMVVGTLGAIGAHFGGPKLENLIKNFNPNVGMDMQGLGADPGPVGAFVRGFQGFARPGHTLAPGMVGPQDPGGTLDQLMAAFGGRSPLPTFSPLADPFRPSARGAVPVTDSEAHARMLKHLKEQVDILTHAEKAWHAIVEAAKLYAKTLSESEGIRIQLTAHLGMLATLNNLRNAQEALLAFQQAGTKEWFQTLQGINQTAEAVSKTRDELRGILFDMQKINAQVDFGEKLFKLAKDSGMGGRDLEAIAGQQVQILTQALLVERARLSTLTEGTTEWFKQKSSIIDIIDKIVRLNKELKDANNKVNVPRLFTPAGRTRGPGFGPELVRDDTVGDGDLAAHVRNLLKFALNPRHTNLDAIAGSMFPQGLGVSPASMGSGTVTPGQHALAEDIGQAVARHAAPAIGQQVAFYVRDIGGGMRDKPPPPPPGSFQVGSGFSQWNSVSTEPVRLASAALNDLGFKLPAAIKRVTEGLKVFYEPGPGMFSAHPAGRVPEGLGRPIRGSDLGLPPLPDPVLSLPPGGRYGMGAGGMLGGRRFPITWGNNMGYTPSGGGGAIPSFSGPIQGPPVPPDGDGAWPPRHNWFRTPTPASGLSYGNMTPSVAPFGIGPYDFWGESMAKNAALGIAYQPHLTGAGSGGGDTIVINGAPIAINLNDPNDVAVIRREAIAAAVATVDKALEKLHQAKQNRGG